MKVVGVIPARYKSTRLEGKPLADILGKPMIQHVWERCREANGLDRILVATDDVRISDAVRAFGGEAIMTDPEHASGSDRAAEAISKIDADIIVNIQGDEPMMNPAMIDEVVAPFRQGTAAGMVTLKKEVFHDSELSDPGVVKVVTAADGLALYFSRSLIPYPRTKTSRFHVYEHIGIYAYTRECLVRLTQLPQSPLEQVEGLEQLRALENGIRIQVVETACVGEAISVDTIADLERVRKLLSERSK